MVCKNCGEEIEILKKSKFCTLCGSMLYNQDEQEDNTIIINKEEDMETNPILNHEFNKKFTDSKKNIYMTLDYDRKSEILTLTDIEGKVLFSDQCDCPTVNKKNGLFIEYNVEKTYYIEESAGGILIYKRGKWKMYSLDKKQFISIPVIDKDDNELIEEFDTVYNMDLHIYKFSYDGKYGLFRWDSAEEDMATVSSDKDGIQPIILADCIYDEIDSIVRSDSIYKAVFGDVVHVIYDFGICFYYDLNKDNVDILDAYAEVRYILNDQYYIIYGYEAIEEFSNGKITLSQDLNQGLYAGESYSEKYEIFYVNANTYDGDKYYIVKDDNKYRIFRENGYEYDLQGDLIIPIYNEYSYLVQNNGYYGVYTIYGKVLVPPIFTDIVFKDTYKFIGTMIEKKVVGKIHYEGNGNYKVEYKEYEFPEYECFDSIDFDDSDDEYYFDRTKLILRTKVEDIVDNEEKAIVTDDFSTDDIIDYSKSKFYIYEDEDEDDDDDDDSFSFEELLEENPELIINEKQLSESKELILGGHIIIYYDEDEWKIFNTDTHTYENSHYYKKIISYGNILFCQGDCETYDLAYYNHMERKLEYLESSIQSAYKVKVTSENQGEEQWLIRLKTSDMLTHYICKNAVITIDDSLNEIDKICKYHNKIHFIGSHNYYIAENNEVFEYEYCALNILYQKKDGKYYCIKNGILYDHNWIAERGYYRSDLFKVSRNGLFGVVNGEGNEIIPLVYSNIKCLDDDTLDDKLRNNYLYLVDQYGKKGVIRISQQKTYEHLIACDYEKVEIVNSGKVVYDLEDLIKIEPNKSYIRVEKMGRYAYYDMDGNLAVHFAKIRKN